MSKYRSTSGIDGSRRANALLTAPRVQAIRKHLKEGMKPQALAEIYGVGVETIRRIGRRETWAWLADDIDLSELEAAVLPPLPPEEEEKIKIALQNAIGIVGEKEKEIPEKKKVVQPPTVSEEVKKRAKDFLG